MDTINWAVIKFGDLEHNPGRGRGELIFTVALAPCGVVVS